MSAAPSPAPPGHNNPPPDSPFEAIRAHVLDLYAEAHGWLDGEPITTQGQADAVQKLLGMIKEAGRAADYARRLENEPFDKGKAEVQARYAELIADNRSMRGKTVLAAEACLKALTPWLEKLDAEREAAAKAARDEAERLATAARETAKGAESLEEAETAEAMFADAKAAERNAKAIEGDRARVGVGSGYKATILRTVWRVEIDDAAEALRTIWRLHRDEMVAFALELAKRDARAGHRNLPGFRVIEDKVAA